MISFLYAQYLKLAHNWHLSVLILTIAALWLMMIADFMRGYALNMTESVEGKIFKIQQGQAIERGSIVIFPWNDPVLPDGVEHMTKHVMCLPGDTLEREGLVFICNGRSITRAKTHTFSGDPLSVFDWPGGPVPEGVFFAATTHPDRYDSRYYGFVPLASATVVERVL